ncbi:MAG: YitT family protein [Candidatus Ventricola sp.]|nr:YitT family protein [Candidatus Ventricola sp.]
MTQSRKSFRPGALLSLLRRVLPPVSLLMLTVAGIVNAFGVVLFLSPVALYDSGISGTSMLFAQIARGIIPFSLFLIVLNVPLFLYGLRREGSTFTIRSIYTVVIYSLAAAFFGRFVTPGASPIAGSDLLLCAIFGGLISGVGSGTTIRYGGALDGIEVLAVIFSRRLGMTVGTFVMTYNALLYVVAGVIMGSWVLPLYSIVTYAIGIKAVDFIVEGLDKTKAAMIITDHPQDICRELSAAFGTGITLIDAHGYYSGDSKTMIYFVVNRFQIARMRTIVHDIDAQAFISITEVSDLFGKNAK